MANTETMPAESIEALREEWNNLYKIALPFCAHARIAVQTEWPVSLDHCFARIILDNAVGKTRPWMEVIKAPAVKNMTEEQLRAAIDMANEIVEGKVDLVGLNEKSLRMRGKEGPPRGKGRVTMKKFLDEAEAEGTAALATKRKSATDDPEHKDEDVQSKKKKTSESDGISKYFRANSPQSGIMKPRDEPAGAKSSSSILPSHASRDDNSSQRQISTPPATVDAITTTPSPQGASQTDPLILIATSALTPFRKEVLSLLCGIPPGQWTSYAAMSRHVNRVRSKTSQSKTCARAIGNAMRNNPFAPMVPCHRVLAADGSIGGFGGDWGEEGKHAGEKKRLLREEGVRFDGKGKAVGSAFEGWK